MTSRPDDSAQPIDDPGAPDSTLQGPRMEPRAIVSSGVGRIRPRARLIRTIGAELISSEVVAILELVRNSYDADAGRVDIRFSDPHHPDRATLEILDNGHGMTEEILLGPWLEPATNYKSQGSKGSMAGERSPAGRRRLGSKGVGRFAAQRLGHRLLVRSRVIGAPVEIETNLDWDVLDNADQYLDDLTIPWRSVDASNQNWHGTSLLITQLKDAWTEERFDRLRLALSRLLGPGLTDNFQIFLVINGIAEEVKPFLDSLPAMYSIEGHVHEGGLAKITYHDIAGTSESWERMVVWPLFATCGPFQFRVNSWDLDKDAVSYFLKRIGARTGSRDFRRAIRDHSGISLYRDGFRILPYGEPDNDWLRLDRRRVNNPTLRLSNNQIFGWVQLNADANPHLQDQTNREGLVANEAYAHLQQVILELLSYLETRRFAARRSLGLAVRSNIISSRPPELTHGFDDLLTELSDSESGSQTRALVELKELVDTQQRATSAALRHHTELASIGLLASKLIPKLSHPVRQALGEAEFVKEEILSSELPSHLRADLLSSVEKLTRVLNRLDSHSHAIIGLADLPESPKTFPARLADCVEAAAGVFLEEFVEHGIELLLKVNADPELSAPPQLIQQVILLVLENATYWVQQAQSGREITAQVYTGGLVIANNGPSIPKGLRKQIFEPYFTLRKGAAGLGLTMAREIMESIGGAIWVSSKKTGAAFDIRLPAQH